MKVTYDTSVDVLRIVLRETAIEESDEVKPGVILDYDAAGHLVGIEILDASQGVVDPGSLAYEIKGLPNIS